MSAIARAVKTTTVTTGFFRLGGTGTPYVTPIGRDVVYADIATTGDFTVGGVTISADKAMRYIPFFAAVRNISEDVAGLPLHVYEKLPGGGRARDDGHPVDEILGSAPNPFMTAFTFRETLQSHVLTWGNGYAEIEFAVDGSILRLWPLRPDRMTVFVDRQTDQVVYRYALSGGGRVDLPRKKVFHVHGLGYDGLVGYSVIERARHLLGMALGAEKYGEDWFSKGGIPPAYLSHPKELSDRARANLRESIDNGTLTDRHRMALLEEGLKIETIGIPPRDSAFLEANGMTRSLTATLFRMPPDMLQDVTRSTSWGTGIEQQGIGYVKYTLRSHLSRWEQEGDARLLAGEPRYLRHVVDGLLRGDSAARWTAYRAGLDLGVYSIDDVLEMEDRNPLAAGLGSQHFVQLNRAPLEQVGEMTMDQRFAALGVLNRAGFQPAPSLEVVGLPPIEHTGLEPVTVSEQGDYVKAITDLDEQRGEREAAARREFIDALETMADSSAGVVAAAKAATDVAMAAASRPLNIEVNPASIDYGAIQVTVPIAEGAIRVVNEAPKPHAVRKRVEHDGNGRVVAIVEEPD